MNVVVISLSLFLGAIFKFPGGDCTFSFIKAPHNLTVVIVGSNNTNVSLHWKCNADEASIGLLNVHRYPLENPSNLATLAQRFGSGGANTISTANFGGRGLFFGSGCEATLLIFNLTVEDGKFKYRAKLSTTDVTDVYSNAINIIIAVAPHDVSVVCDHAVLGQAMTCYCTANGNPLPDKFQWIASNGSVLGNNNSYTTPLVERSLGGNYFTCIASNGFEPSATMNTSIFYVKEKPSSVEISPYPSVTVNETGNATLKCNASGGIPAVYHYKWQHNGNAISRGENGTLTLINVQSIKTGNYSCQGCNEFGCASNLTSLIVLVKPNRVQISPHPSVTINETGIATLTCLALGGIPASYHYKWQLNGIAISGEENRTFTLINVKRVQNGRYSCQGCNLVGCISNSTGVIVQYQPSNISLVADPNRTVVAGKPLTLICTFDSGNLPVSVEWKFNNTPILEHTDRSLVIKKVIMSDSGTYECTAMNILGNVTGKIDITVTSDVCGETPCNGNGNCSIHSGLKLCKCEEGWHGKYCSACTCFTEGTAKGGCDVVDREPFCDCKKNYVGKFCNKTSDELYMVKGAFSLTNYTYEDSMTNISSTAAKKLIAYVRPRLQSGTSAKACKVTQITKGSVKIHFELFFEKGNEGEKKEAVKKFINAGKLGNYNIKAGSLVLEEDSDDEGNKDQNSKMSRETVIIIVVIAVVLVIVIIAIVVWRVKKYRCSRVRKVSNGEEHNLCSRSFNNPNVGYNNKAVEHAPYVEDGPTVTRPQDGKDKKESKPVVIYAEVDRSKKSKKKKPEVVLYADLADFPPSVATEGSNAQQTVKKPEKCQSTDYASITDVIKEKEGKPVIVPIADPNQSKLNNRSKDAIKAVDDIKDGTVVTPKPVEDEKLIEGPKEASGPNLHNNAATGRAKIVNGGGKAEDSQDM